MNEDLQPELPIPPWLRLTKENIVACIIIAAILLVFIYSVFASLSTVLVKFGNDEFSSGNDNLGKASYNLALEFNSDLKTAMNRCNTDDAQKQYDLAIIDCSKAIEINENYFSAYYDRGYAN